MKSPTIYFLLPVYNEEQNIKILILKLYTLMKNKEYRIIVVNDGSFDNTAKVLNQLKNPRITIEDYYINMNIGAAFSTGINRALLESKHTGDIVIIMESDQTSEVELISELITQINKGNDIVIASRYKKEGKYINFPLTRRLFSLTANKLMKIYFPIHNVHDYTIFFRAYRISVLKKAVQYFGPFGLIQSKGFVANAELLIKLSFLTPHITEIPFVYDYRKKIGKTKIKILKTINEYFVLIHYLKRLAKKIKKRKEASL